MAANIQPIPTLPPFDWMKNIWNVKTSPKLKDFLWKLAKKAILVSENLASRAITPFPCKTCAGVEDDLHVFLHCPVAREVWNLVPMETLPSTASPTVQDLISSCFSYRNLPPSGVLIPLWPWVLWNLWKARNKLCFENHIYSAMEITNKSILDALEWQNAQESPSATSCSTGPSNRIATMPAADMSGDTCHVDAAWDALTGTCGLGGIFAGSIMVSKLPLLSETRSFVSSALMAEALAVRLAVMTAAFSNIKSLLILSYSLTLIKLLKGKESRPELFGILFDIYHFSSYFDAISFSFILRLQNSDADLVAKSALSNVCISSSRLGV